MTGLVAPGLAWNAQTPASGTTRLPSCTLSSLLNRADLPICEPERAGHGVEGGGIGAVGTELLQAVGLGIELVAVGAGDLDGKQDVPALGLLTLAAGDLDQVIAELGAAPAGRPS